MCVGVCVLSESIERRYAEKNMFSVKVIKKITLHSDIRLYSALCRRLNAP